MLLAWNLILLIIVDVSLKKRRKERLSHLHTWVPGSSRRSCGRFREEAWPKQDPQLRVLVLELLLWRCHRCCHPCVLSWLECNALPIHLLTDAFRHPRLQPPRSRMFETGREENKAYHTCVRGPNSFLSLHTWLLFVGAGARTFLSQTSCAPRSRESEGYTESRRTATEGPHRRRAAIMDLNIWSAVREDWAERYGETSCYYMQHPKAIMVWCNTVTHWMSDSLRSQFNVTAQFMLPEVRSGMVRCTANNGIAEASLAALFHAMVLALHRNCAQSSKLTTISNNQQPSIINN